MSGAERRRRSRCACDLQVEVFLPDKCAGTRLGEGTLIDVSLDGGLLAFTGTLWEGIAYVLRTTTPAVAVLPCRVARAAGASVAIPALRYFGMVFELSPEQEEMFALTLELIRKPRDKSALP